MQRYHPKNKVMWDSWFISNNGETHIFYLQAERANNSKGHSEEVSVGHAISRDLINWTELPIALVPGPAGSWDDLAIWTGSIIEKESLYYMFYTGKNQRHRNIQQIGLATSSDLIHWNKHKNNPILKADNKYYEMNNKRNSLGVISAWRDPYVFFDPKSRQYFITISARSKQTNQEYNGCIALATSKDLKDWQVLEPILNPKIYDEMETSQMILHLGKYYLFFGIPWPDTYKPSWSKEIGSHTGLHCYYSDSLQGEYRPVNEIGVVFEGSDQLYDMRLIPNSDNTYTAIGWLNRDRNNRFLGELSPPYKVQINNDLVTIVP